METDAGCGQRPCISTDVTGLASAAGAQGGQAQLVRTGRRGERVEPIVLELVIGEPELHAGEPEAVAVARRHAGDGPLRPDPHRSQRGRDLIDRRRRCRWCGGRGCGRDGTVRRGTGRPGEEERAADDDGQNDDHSGERRPSKEPVHSDPPSWAKPGRPLPNTGGLPEDIDEVIRRTRGGQVGQRLREMPLDRIDGRGHAYCPSGTLAGAGASARTMTLRRTDRDRCRRDFAVPNRIPRTSATSGSGIPR